MTNEISVKINSALISVFNKENIEEIAQLLHQNNVKIYSTGGTEIYLKEKRIPIISVESLTSFPSIFGGRVKTLHPKVFGGILHQRGLDSDMEEASKYEIPSIDLVIVDLYPFVETVNSGASDADIIEKIDIGGVSLIRATAKNYNHTSIISHKKQYSEILSSLKQNGVSTTLSQRKKWAFEAFRHTYEYDQEISNYLNPTPNNIPLRYGENPHQKAHFEGNISDFFSQLHGKELSYNNLLDLDSALSLLKEFDQPTFAIIKHNNPCGVATSKDGITAWKEALSCDPISAFGGVLVSNQKITLEIANEIYPLFYEILCAPDYDKEALELLQKKKRIILKLNNFSFLAKSTRSVLNGVLVQERDTHTDNVEDFKFVTKLKPSKGEIDDLIFASKICKNTKSNTIVLVKNMKLLAAGTGQTSRVDALKQAIQKAESFDFDLKGSVMVSDAFFPFPDCVEIAQKSGIKSVLHPGGSIQDQLSINYCDTNDVSMVITGFRHFKH